MKLIFSPILIIIFVLISIIAIQTPDTYVNLPTEQKADFTFENVKISMLKSGKKVWTITADSSYIFSKTNSFYLDNIDGLVTAENDENSKLSFQSPAGIFKTDSQMLQLIQTKSKLTINGLSYFIISDEIEIGSKNRLINAYGNILINSDTIIVQGNQMTANLNENKLYLKDDVRGSFINPASLN